MPSVVASFVGFFATVGAALGATAVLTDRLPLLLFAVVSFAFAASSLVLGYRGRARDQRAAALSDAAAPAELELTGGIGLTGDLTRL